MFIERKTPQTKVEIIKTKVPTIFITSKALTKMKILTEECKNEIGWLGTATKEENKITIDDVYLIEQEVHASTTEITPEGLEKFAEQLLQQEGGLDLWNNIKLWGHSHVNMSVTPSGQDDKQMETFAQVAPWFIRIIVNKKGDLKADYYDYETGLVYLDVPWEEKRAEDENEILKLIDNLFEELEKRQKIREERLSTPLKQEIKEKVKEKTYAYQQTKHSYSNWFLNYKKQYEYEYDDSGDWLKFNYNGYDVIKSDKEIDEYFYDYELNEIAACKSIEEVEDYLMQLQYNGYFSRKDLQRIYQYAKGEQKNG